MKQRPPVGMLKPSFNGPRVGEELGEVPELKTGRCRGKMKPVGRWTWASRWRFRRGLLDVFKVPGRSLLASVNQGTESPSFAGVQLGKPPFPHKISSSTSDNTSTTDPSLTIHRHCGAYATVTQKIVQDVKWGRSPLGNTPPIQLTKGTKMQYLFPSYHRAVLEKEMFTWNSRGPSLKNEIQ